jgi:hypothetical protein
MNRVMPELFRRDGARSGPAPAKTSTKSPPRTRTLAREPRARRAESLLTDVATDADYWIARQEVRALGIDPDSIPHTRPS